MKGKCYAIILASGEGKRFEGKLPKQFIWIKGKTVIEHTIKTFDDCPDVDEIILVVNPDYKYFVDKLLLNEKYSKLTKIINGGKLRVESAYNGLKSAGGDDNDIVLIHDAVRPFVTLKCIQDCIIRLNNVNSVGVAVPVTDTIYQFRDNNEVTMSVDRNKLLRAQTPQGFRIGLIRKAYELAIKDKDIEFTDDVSIILHYNLDKVYWVPGDESNIKITYPVDEEYAKLIMDTRELEK